MRDVLLAIDVGTTGTKVAVFNQGGTLLGSAYREYPTYYPEEGFAEQSVEDWWIAVCQGSREIFTSGDVKMGNVACISLSAHMMGTIPVNGKGEVLTKRVPIWADARAVTERENVFERIGGYERWYGIAQGGHLPERYPLFKYMWLRDNAPEQYKKVHKFLNTKDAIIQRLTGVFATDYSDASLTGALDESKRAWSLELLDAAGIPPDLLPDLRESTDVVGHLQEEAAKQLGLPAGIPVVLGGGDSACAAAGAGALSRGGSFLVIGSALWAGIVDERPLFDFEGKMNGHWHAVPNLYVSFMVMITGAIAQQWVKETMYGLETIALAGTDISVYQLMIERARQVDPRAEALLYLPYMRGGEAPHNNPDSRGAFIGLDLTKRREHLYHAVLEGSAFNIRTLLERIDRHAESSLKRVRVIGGGAMNDLWMQILADVCSREMETIKLKQEANCLGAAIIGGVGVGLFDSFDKAKALIAPDKLFEPNEALRAHYDRKYRLFQEAYEALVPIYRDLAEMRAHPYR
jgi:xylulokinase